MWRQQQQQQQQQQPAAESTQPAAAEPLLLSNGRPVPASLNSAANDYYSTSSGRSGRRNRICLLPFPAFGCAFIDLSQQHDVVVYLSGLLFGLGWWLFIDAAVQAGLRDAPALTHWGAEDYVPGICVTLGMLVINSVDRSALQGSHHGRTMRLMLFIGVALLAGGLAGSLSILTIKYIVPGVTGVSLYLGIAVVIQTFLIMISSIILWFAQFDDSEYEISLGL